MKKAIIIIILFSLLAKTNRVEAQIILSPNYVNNPSFEQYDTCPNEMCELYYAKYWWGYKTEYFNACAGSGVASVPSNFFGYQYAHSGVAYAGCCIYSNEDNNINYRVSIKTKLSDSLIVNKRYCSSFYVSLANCNYTWTPNDYLLLDSIGILFTNDSVKDSIGPILSNGIKFQNDIFNIDSVNWLKIPNSFIADGGEHYLTIGNFDNVIINPGGGIYQVYVYVDDVSVCECSFNFSLGNDTTLCNGESITLSPNMPNATYTWQDGSHGTTYTVTQPGTYWVSAYFPDYNITTTDTINIMYRDCDNPIYIPTGFTPGGGINNIFKVLTVAEFSQFNMIIYYRWYGKLFESNDVNTGWDGTYRGKLVPSGVYVYLITATIKGTNEKIERTGYIDVVR